MRNRLIAKMAAVLALSAIVTLGLPAGVAGADVDVAVQPPDDLTPGAGQPACSCESEPTSDVTAPPPEQTEPTTEPTAAPDPAPAEPSEAEPTVPADSPPAEPSEAEPTVPADSPPAEPSQGEPTASPPDSGVAAPHPVPDPGGTTAAPAVDPSAVSEPVAPSADPVVEPMLDLPVDVTTDLAVPAGATPTVRGASALTSDSAAPQDDSLQPPPGPAPRSPVFGLRVAVNGRQPSARTVAVSPGANRGAPAAAASVSEAALDPINAIDPEIRDHLGPSDPHPVSAFARTLESTVTASMAVFVPRAATTTVSVAVEFGRAGNGWAGAIVFNVWLRRRLRERRMSQRQLAWLSGVNHSTISRLLTGDRSPSLTTATKLARALRAANGEEDTSSYFARFTEEAVFPTARVEMALRGDEALDDDDVRGLMQAYLVARARRRRGREPSAAERSKAAPALSNDEMPMLTDLPRSVGRGP